MGTSTADFADEFARRAAAGDKPSAQVGLRHAELFLGQLARHGIALARECLEQIRDERLRRIVETIFFSTAGGAVLGAAIGGSIAGLPGAKVGAVVGTVAGAATAVFAIMITAKEGEGPDGPYLLVTVS